MKLRGSLGLLYWSVRSEKKIQLEEGLFASCFHREHTNFIFTVGGSKADGKTLGTDFSHFREA